jgi:pimeloyl-ACP methyl ester carboxylesterase
MIKETTFHHKNAEIFCRYRPGAEPAILFLHGAGGDSSAFTGQLEGIDDPAMAAPDLPQHGRSSFQGDLDFTDYVDAAEAAAAHFGFSKIVPAGHSMGSGIVFELWKRRPDLVAGMIFIAAGASLPVNPAILELIQKDYQGFCGMAAVFCFKPGGDGTSAAAFGQSLSAAGPQVTHRDFLFCSRYAYNDVAATVTVPTLIIASEKDKMVSRKIIAALHESIKGSRLALIPSEGHMPHMDEAAAVNREISAFMEGL